MAANPRAPARWLRRLAPPPGDLLRDAVYRRLWASILISSFGGQVTMLALPLTAAVLLKATPTQMGLLGAVEIAPFVLFSLPGGVWLDRVRKLPVYIGGESGPAMRRAARLGDGWIGTGTAPDQLASQIEKLRSLRGEAGRDHLPFETMASVAALPDPDVYRRLEEQGLTGVVHWPFKYWLGESSTLEEKRAGMEQYAERVIVPLNG